MIADSAPPPCRSFRHSMLCQPWRRWKTAAAVLLQLLHALVIIHGSSLRGRKRNIILSVWWRSQLQSWREGRYESLVDRDGDLVDEDHTNSVTRTLIYEAPTTWIRQLWLYAHSLPTADDSDMTGLSERPVNRRPRPRLSDLPSCIHDLESVVECHPCISWLDEVSE